MSEAAVPGQPGVRSTPVRLVRRSAARAPAPTSLLDGYGRLHSDLRISITDRCNLRCTYCMPDEGVEFRPRAELLSPAEIERIARVAASLGVTSVRITGGEPLVRSDVVEIVASLKRVGFADLSLTTNATLLGRRAAALVEAGLDRVNVSCDSLRAERFSSIRRRGRLDVVLEAMDLAEAAGLPPVKVNVVVMRGVNDDEVVDFATFARRTGRSVRFIEFMPLDGDRSWTRDQVVPGAEVLERIAARYPLVPLGPLARANAPAERFAFADGLGEIGVVASVTQPFCGTCNRLRLTADGALRNCLFSDDELSVRDAVRGGADDEALAALLCASVGAKRRGHGMDEVGFVAPVRSMSMIGG